ncbi:unnamed protein product [Vitrella brassicaformis CCMP3155]|uniref:PLOD1-3-like GT domain-containing protein n=2 Tax=Vitrella brassicaformis TaxID=1169539 RepID=A0A0G4ENF1_VITBC|nr:unnamed protein product [Vitrella brassicaformis CCMP3155]|mmetsp:Transcript_46374/g.115379  ORF Transcript_46374/g.115379 Transcript_46374/m.115379 type:complete len:424 (+) Transcript_46374:181-1452(+)|eukprot:CEL98361.1 unnamed protein product [Vitrella brassicaformis CCMP3155]
MAASLSTHQLLAALALCLLSVLHVASADDHHYAFTQRSADHPACQRVLTNTTINAPPTATHNLTLITVATSNRGYLPALLESAKRYKINVVILGWGWRWKGTSTKIFLLKEALRCLPPDSLVMFSDGFDTFLNSPPEEILSRFFSYRRKLIFSAEPDPADVEDPMLRWLMLVGRYVVHHLPHTWSQDINSGGWIGYAQTALLFFEELMTTIEVPSDTNDQPLINAFAWEFGRDRFREDWGLDYRRELFYCLWPKKLLDAYWQTLFHFTDKNFDWTGVLDVDRDEKRVVRVYNGVKPSVIHANGCINLDSFCAGVELPAKIKRDKTTKQCFFKVYYAVRAATIGGVLAVLGLLWLIIARCCGKRRSPSTDSARLAQLIEDVRRLQDAIGVEHAGNNGRYYRKDPLINGTGKPEFTPERELRRRK